MLYTAARPTARELGKHGAEGVLVLPGQPRPAGGPARGADPETCHKLVYGAETDQSARVVASVQKIVER